jgi:hypothetical protein
MDKWESSAIPEPEATQTMTLPGLSAHEASDVRCTSFLHQPERNRGWLSFLPRAVANNRGPSAFTLVDVTELAGRIAVRDARGFFKTPSVSIAPAIRTKLEMFAPKM